MLENLLALLSAGRFFSPVFGVVKSIQMQHFNIPLFVVTCYAFCLLDKNRVWRNNNLWLRAQNGTDLVAEFCTLHAQHLWKDQNPFVTFPVDVSAAGGLSVSVCATVFVFV